jgi:hypothetical protein
MNDKGLDEVEITKSFSRTGSPRRAGWDKRVIMLLRYIPQYRLPFFAKLHEACNQGNIDLQIVYGNPTAADATKADSVDFEPGFLIPNRSIKVGSSELIWQPALIHTRDADLVIVEQQSKLLLNYLLIARQLLGRGKIAFFGHGKNLQGRTNSPAEAVKRRMALLPHWWFAYTEGVAHYLMEIGYPADRVTVFNNQ